MSFQFAATKLMAANPNSTAPRMAKTPAAPMAGWRAASSALMAAAPASLTQPADCPRVRSPSTLLRYQDIGGTPSPRASPTSPRTPTAGEGIPEASPSRVPALLAPHADLLLHRAVGEGEQHGLLVGLM